MSSNQTETVSEGTEIDTSTTASMEVDEAATQVDEDSVEGAADATGDEAGPGPLKRAASWCGSRWVGLLVTAVMLASAGAAGGVYWWMLRPDQLTDAAAQTQVVAAAKEGTVSLLSYAPDTLDEDLKTAKSHLTGEFLKYYSQFTDTIVAPAAKERGVKTEATVARAAVEEMHPDRAVVMVFVNQVTTSKDRPEPALATSSVMVTMVKSDGQWLISEFKPV